MVFLLNWMCLFIGIRFSSVIFLIRFVDFFLVLMIKFIFVVCFIFFFVVCVLGLKWWLWFVISVWIKMFVFFLKGFEYIFCVNIGIFCFFFDIFCGFWKVFWFCSYVVKGMNFRDFYDSFWCFCFVYFV